MAIIMTRECGFGPLLNNYIKISNLEIISGSTGHNIEIELKIYLSKESRDYEKMKKYIIENNLLPPAKGEEQITFLDTHWNKPPVLTVGTAHLSFPIKLSLVANKSIQKIFAEAYHIIKKSNGALGWKEGNPTNILEDNLETKDQFVHRVITPFLKEYDSLVQ